MIISIILAIVSGVSMTIQGVFNTRLSSKIGLYETTVIVQIIALIASLIITYILGDGNFKAVKDVNKLYLLGGVLSVAITFTVMKSIGTMGATVGISIILVAQLLSAAIIDYFGWFDSEKIILGIKQIIGIILMIFGIIIFKWK